MALKPTIFKAKLQVSDLDRAYFAEHTLTIARHPSETDERMMVRLLAFALYADEQLQFGKGLSTDDEPALWLIDDRGLIQCWIEVGLPDERVVRKACGRSEQVVVFAYGARKLDVWWGKEAEALRRLDKLRVFAVPEDQSAALTALAQRNMSFQVTIQEGQIWWSDEQTALSLNLTPLLAPS